MCSFFNLQRIDSVLLHPQGGFMATYSQTGSGGLLLGATGGFMSTYANIASGGIGVAGRALVPNSDNYNYVSVGSSCTRHASTSGSEFFCCMLGTRKRSVNWKKINGAYVSAVTVCTMRLF